MYQKTTALTKLQSLIKRIKVLQGGTAAGKTIAVLLYLIDKAQRKKLSISVVSESLPHLKRGALRDFLNIMQEHRYYKEDFYNRTDKIYTFETGSTMEFFAIDEVGKVRGPRRDILFINEANNIPYEIYDQLEVRTNQEIILDYNPVSEFWVHTEVIPKQDHDFLKLTYLDNEAVDPRIKASIESRKDRENWWRVYGLGEIGSLEGRIFNWEIIDKIPEEARLEAYGGDFGFSIDPTTLIGIYYQDNTYILDEFLYATNLTNKNIADQLKRFPGGSNLPSIFDSAEPKSIEELRQEGVNAIPSIKGPDSVNYGIQLMQGLTIKVTKRSVNLIKEMRNYLWKLDKSGKPLNVPVDVWNHGIDAARYAITFLKQDSELIYEFV